MMLDGLTNRYKLKARKTAQTSVNENNGSDRFAR
jgi:hypothetical protein